MHTISLAADWRAALRRAVEAAQADRCRGETLNIESPGAFFGRLLERPWAMLSMGLMVLRPQ